MTAQQSEVKQDVDTYAQVQAALRHDPWNFEFFQTIRLLERMGAGKPIGRFENPGEEAVRAAS